MRHRKRGRSSPKVGAGGGKRSRAGSGGKRRRWPRVLLALCAVLVLAAGGLAIWEMRTSHLQARYMAPLARELTWTVGEGPSPSVVPAPSGPYDRRFGYSEQPMMVARAQERGFRVAEQAQVSERFRELVEDWGLFPIYPTKTRAGLRILGREGELLYDHPRPEAVYPSFESVPPLIWQTLLFVENRTALDPDRPTRNPAVEWSRLLRSTADLGLRYLGREGRVAGASTLATQIEKFRHAPDGLTESPRDKVLQMASASFRAYLDGEETLPARRRIVLDYLNSVPLAAIRGEGEILGLAEGLRAWFGVDLYRVNWLLARIEADRLGPIPRPDQVLPPGTPRAASYWEAGRDRSIITARVAEDEPVAVRTVALEAGGASQAPAPQVDTAPSPEAVDEEGDAGDVPEMMYDDDGSEGTAHPGSLPPLTDEEWREAGVAYRQVLSLLLAQRRPSYHLTTSEGREALRRLTDRHIRLLAGESLIPPRLASEAEAAHWELRVLPPPRPPVSFIERKATDAVRTQLLGVLGVERLYDLDRLDLTVRTTIDGDAQGRATDFLTRLQDPAFVRDRGFDGYRLLDRGDPARLVYSVALHERTPRGNVVRIHVDNLDAPFNLNESARLELGSTAKLRTLATYLEIIAELHGNMSWMSQGDLRAYPVAAQDRLSLWVRNQLLAQPDLDLETLLARAMERSYSANPAQRFVTGGGVQSFSNFDRTYDQQVVSVSVGFQQSINLVFVRMMRDIVDYYMYRVPGSTAHVLEERDSPLRQEYLSRFADREGIQFMNQFIPRYRQKSHAEILDALLRDRRLSPQRIAWAYRTVVPNGTVEEFEHVLRQNQPDAAFSEATVQDLFRRADPGDHPLADLGYLASVHPLELWVAGYLRRRPQATHAEMIRESAQARQDVYRWLFRTRFTDAQDRRIRSLLEVEAFTEVLRGWQRVGYPFQNIVPSLGTSIGSSGDRPSALNDLVGIILNDGVRLPTHRVEELHFARDTPYEARLERAGVEGEQVMAPEVARTLRRAMVEVVELGTGRRTRGAVRAPDGAYLPIGAKTGTGDNRFRVFAPGGRLVESRSVNRTSTIVFFIGDRYYGVITAYVPGEEADGYHFTSALTAQILRELGPVVGDLLAAEERRVEALPASTQVGAAVATDRGEGGDAGGVSVP